MVTEVAGYVLRERIGSSATATVWRGEAVGAPGRIVAIKLIPNTRGRAATDALQHEAEILGRLSHPHILPVLATVPASDGLALVTGYAPGGSLAAMLERGSGKPAEPHGSAAPHRSEGVAAGVAAELGAHLASALAAIHGAGIVHGDVRPANVLFDREHRPLLADAGIARWCGDPTIVAGTAEYLDPSLFDGREPDARSDLYALGVTLYEALAGVPPYTGTTTAETVAAAERGRFVPLADQVHAPRALTAVIEAAFAHDLRDRPAGAHEFAGHLEEIRRVIADDGSSPRPPANSGCAGVLGAVPSPTRSFPGSRRREPHPPPAAGVDPVSTEGAATPSPRTPVDEDATTPRHRSRMLIAVAVTAIVLVPTAVMVVSFGDGATGTADTDDVAVAAGETSVSDATDDEPAAPTPEPDQTTQPPVAPISEREPAPSCEGLRTPDDGREILLADLEGMGCSAVVAWDGRRLEVFGGDGSVDRYDLGAGPGDVLRFGDWTCDGRDTPALYRPTDGRLFTFDEIAPGARITATGTPTGILEGVPTVVTDAAGCDRVEIEP